jgi:signal transduction histidine kinase/DNA-binding NarL/FixJ family response regulator
MPAAGPAWQRPAILTGGLAVSAVLAVYVLLLLRRRSSNEALVRRRTQEADAALAQLKRSDERFRDYVTTASDWYWEAGPDLYFTMVAERAAKFGIDRGALLGLARLTEAEDPERGDRRLDVLRKRVAFQDLRYEYPRDDGVLSLSLNGLPVFDDKGVFQGYRGCARDITAQRRAEAAQNDALWAAEQNNRAKSAFLANMSHEIRTPMNGVLGMVQVLRTTGLDADQRRMVEVIYQSATGLLTILNDILDYSKLEAGKVQMEAIGCSLTEMVEGVTMLLRHVADAKGVGLICHLPPDKPPPVLTDPTRLRQVLLNLVSNAIKFSYEGAVTIRLQTAPADGGRLQITLAVADQGIGISEEAQKSLFGRFNQADASATRLFGGTGLGLAITRELVALMGGDVGVTSTLGIGSIFTVALTLPVATADDMPVATGSPKALTGPVKTLQVLVAEDDEINWLVIRSFLEAEGHRATLVVNGEEAVAAVQAAHYDLVLMDSMMPVMDGVTATRRIRQLHLEHGPVPIIALTANAMVGDREKYMKAGMDGYVSKPIDRGLLFEAMENVLGVRVCRPVAAAVAPAPAAAQAQAAAVDDIEAFMASLDP